MRRSNDLQPIGLDYVTDYKKLLDLSGVRNYVDIVQRNIVVQSKGFDMKRQYVIPDLLASITADALFAGRVVRRPDEPAPAEPGPGNFKRLATWIRTNRSPTAGLPPLAGQAPATSIKDEQ